MICTISIQNGHLLAVPAVHYRLVFAELVNRVCARNPRPEAVAVELGPGAVAAVTSWLRELGVAPGRERRDLPCMLGLVRPNHCIHPNFKSRAIRLQELYGLPLQQVPAHILLKELRYSSLGLLCLSATDSIIEAIRSAIEWDIPLYGVDLEEFAGCDRTSVMLEDPLTARNDLRGYVERNARHGMSCRDPWVDSRREQFMAARLRELIKRHESVLFTGGLSHWIEIERLLKEPQPSPASSAPRCNACAYERVIVDPSIAIHQMDMLPDFTLHYEALRKLPLDAKGRKLPYREIVFDTLRDVYQSVVDSEGAEFNARERVADYFSYLGNLCLLNQRVVPDIFLALSVASSMVSKQFAEQLAHPLITNAIPWAKPEDYPNLRYLRPLRFDAAERSLSDRWLKAELVGPEGHHGPHFVTGPDQDLAVGRDAPLLPFQFESSFPNRSESESDSSDSDHSPNSWVWPPCENLFYGTAYKAGELALTRATQGTAEPFAGTLYEGIDSKATVRAAARGDDRLYVRVKTACRTSSPDAALQEPFVYIFDRAEAARYVNTHWNLTQGGSTLGNHIRPDYRQRFEEVTRRYGSMFIAGVYFSEAREPGSRLSDCHYISSMNLLWGAVAFGNPCVNSIQSARWIEGGNFRCCPILHGGGIESMVRMYADPTRHGVSLDLENWAETLIRMAIQYARHRVVVIAPDYSVFSPRSQKEARSRRISLDFQPLSYFSAERIAAIRRQYLVYPKDRDATQWPEEVIQLLGQKSDAYLDLLPSSIRAQTVENG